MSAPDIHGGNAFTSLGWHYSRGRDCDGASGLSSSLSDVVYRDRVRGNRGGARLRPISTQTNYASLSLLAVFARVNKKEKFSMKFCLCEGLPVPSHNIVNMSVTPSPSPRSPLRTQTFLHTFAK